MCQIKQNGGDMTATPSKGCDLINGVIKVMTDNAFSGGMISLAERNAVIKETGAVRAQAIKTAGISL